MTPDLTWAT